MTKEEFNSMLNHTKRDLVKSALVRFCLLESSAPFLMHELFSCEDISVIKIILGAYMNGELKEVTNVSSLQ